MQAFYTTGRETSKPDCILDQGSYRLTQACKLCITSPRRDKYQKWRVRAQNSVSAESKTLKLSLHFTFYFIFIFSSNSFLFFNFTLQKCQSKIDWKLKNPKALVLHQCQSEMHCFGLHFLPARMTIKFQQKPWCPTWQPLTTTHGY